MRSRWLLMLRRVTPSSYSFLVTMLGGSIPREGSLLSKTWNRLWLSPEMICIAWCLSRRVNSLSERELEFLTAMAEGEGPHRVSDIAGLMGISENNATKIRARLIEQEIIGARRRGFVDFDMPMIRDYLTKGQYI